MTTNSTTDDTDESAGKRGIVSRREAMALIAAGVGSATLAGAATSDTSGNTGIGGGPMSEPGRRADLYDVHAGDEIPDPVQGRYLRIVDDRAGWDAGDVLEVRNDEWQPINVGVGSLNAEVLDNRQRLTTTQDNAEGWMVRRGAAYPLDVDIATAQDDTVSWEGHADSHFSDEHAYRGDYSFHFAGNGFDAIELDEAIDLTDKWPSMMVYHEDEWDDDERDIGIRYEDVNGVRVRCYTTVGTNMQVSDRWTRINTPPRSSVPDGFDPTQVEKIGISVYDSDTDYVDDIRFHSARDRGGVMLTFDNGNRDQYDVFFDIMDKYGVAGSIALMSNLGDLTEEEVHEMNNKGWEVMSKNHDNSELAGESEEYQEEKIREGKENLLDYGFGDINAIVYRGNKYDETTLDVVEKYHPIAFSGQTTGRRSFNLPEPPNPWALNRGRSGSASTIISRLESAMDWGLISTWYWHNTSEIPESEFEEVIKWIANNDIDVMLPSDLLAGSTRYYHGHS